MAETLVDLTSHIENSKFGFPIFGRDEMVRTKEITRIEMVDIGLIDIEDTTFQYRRDVKNIGNLAADIKANGQTTPVFLREVGEGRHQIISGNRRLAALKQLKRKKVLARVFPNCTDERAWALSISENFQRDDFSDLEKALVCQRLREEGKANGEVGRVTNMSKRNVQHYLSVANADEVLREALHEGKISLFVTVALARKGNVFLDPDHTLEAVLEKATREEMTVKEVEGLLKEIKEAAVDPDKRPDMKKRRGRGKFVPVKITEKKNGGFDLVVKWRATRNANELVKITDALRKTMERIEALKASERN